MNANFGVVLFKSDRESHFRRSSRETRAWGEEIVEVGEEEYACNFLVEVRCQIYPVTAFIKRKLSPELSSGEIEYVYMYGAGLEDYVTWLGVHSDDEDVQLHPFESGLLDLLNRSQSWAVMFAPAGDRLEESISVTTDELVRLLRANMRSIASSDGFLANKR